MKKFLKFTPVIVMLVTPVVWFYTTDDVLVKLGLIFVFATVILPISTVIFKAVLLNAVRGSKYKKQIKQKHGFDVREYQAIKNIYKEEREQYYLQARDLFKTLMQTKQLNREEILALKKMLDDYIGEEGLLEYKDYKHRVKDAKGKEVVKKGFDNDAHEIYVKFRNFSITKFEWVDIINFLKGCTTN